MTLCTGVYEAKSYQIVPQLLSAPSEKFEPHSPAPLFRKLWLWYLKSVIMRECLLKFRPWSCLAGYTFHSTARHEQTTCWVPHNTVA